MKNIQRTRKESVKRKTKCKAVQYGTNALI